MVSLCKGARPSRTTAVLAALILFAPVTAWHPAAQANPSAQWLPLSPRPASTGSSGPLARVPSESGPNYDEQLGFTFTQNFDALAYNVTALAQTDANGYGPAYLLNGLSTANYWYQVGVSYHWPESNGAYQPGFGFSYQVYGPNGEPVYPAAGGAGLSAFSTTVNSGDIVLLSLAFSGSNVEMSAKDWSTGATASASYSREGASSFAGEPSAPSNSVGFFTGLMTEWYHLSPYEGNEGGVTYSNSAVSVSSAWLWMDEYNPSNPNEAVFANQSDTAVTFANPQQLYPLESDGATIYGSTNQFITGALNSDHSKVTLIPATSGPAPPTFEANYTLAGAPQSSEVSTGSIVEADPGTSITISVSPSSSSASEKSVFAGSGATAVTSVTFAAGVNVTYAYYQLLEETVGYQVAGGGTAPPSPPVLTYEVPPAAPSSTPAQVAATQVLGASSVEVFAIGGSTASLSGDIAGTAGERWATVSQDWTLSTPNLFTGPFEFYQQYEVGLEYALVGGGTPAETPDFTSTSFGSPVTVSMAGNATSGWFDAGSDFSFTGSLNSSTAGERWVYKPSPGAPANGYVISQAQTMLAGYYHQFYATLGVNDPAGGSISEASAWVDSGRNLAVSATANNDWQFEAWEGAGPGAYNGTHAAFSVPMIGPVSENATFWVQLVITPDVGTNVAYSYRSVTGSVAAGNASFLYVPPATNVTLRASPATFIYSFASWRGTGITNATKPTLSIVVDGPTTVTNTSAYNVPVLLGLAIAPIVAILIAGVWLRSWRRKRAAQQGFGPG